MNASDLPFVLGALALLGLSTFVLVRPLWRVARGAAIALPAGLLVWAVGTYAWLGQPGVWGERVAHEAPAQAPAEAQPEPGQAGPNTPGAPQQVGQAQIEGMVQRLADRLKQNPDDAAGWRMLVRSYENLNRFDEAVLAWQRLFQLAPPDADQLTEYAVTLGMARGQRLAGEPEQVLEEVLKRDPLHVQALALSGSAAYERHDYDRAIQRWQQLLRTVPPEDEVRARITAQIDKARELAAREARPGREK